MRYLLQLSFDGTSYHGWQTQPGDDSVQQTVEEALSKMFRIPVAVTGAGRTDAGVNARKMPAHIDLPEEIATAWGLPTDPSNLCARELSLTDRPQNPLFRSFNSIVGGAIALQRIVRVPDDFHARFDATSRTYHYYVHHGKDPFLRHYSLLIPPLDYEVMNRAAALLLDTEDFTSFAKLHSDARTNICCVSEARWEDLGEGRHRFVITADRFLRNMVRAVVGTLVEVGRGKLTSEGFSEIIARRDRCAAGTSMPPYPLFLWDVRYDSHGL